MGIINRGVCNRCNRTLPLNLEGFCLRCTPSPTVEKLREKPKVDIPKEIPPLGFTTRCSLVRVVDADTVEVEVKRTFKVRLLDRWKAERNTDEGKQLKKELEDKLPIGSELTLMVPSNQPEKLMDVNSFERILGHIWTEEGERL